MATTARRESRTVPCPHCDRETSVSVAGPGVELAVRRYAAPYGDHATVECPAGHAFWTYYC